MEETAWNIDRLVTAGAPWSGRPDRWIVPALYEGAVQQAGGKPLSLVAAQRIVKEVKAGDSVILIVQFGYAPNQPWGETDGPPGVASLARAISFGLGAVPVLVTGTRDMAATREAIRAAGLSVIPYEETGRVKSARAGEILFPTVNDADSKKAAERIITDCQARAVICVETAGPNRFGVKHSSAGYDLEAEEKMPKLEHLFYEAASRQILTLAVVDRGNELGSGSIEATTRKVTPYADVCRCPCKGGGACSVKADVVFPAFMSNWGAYAISAMMAYLLKRPDVLQDEDTEYRILDACVKAGAIDSVAYRATLSADGIDVRSQQALVTLLHTIVENGLRDPMIL